MNTDAEQERVITISIRRNGQINLVEHTNMSNYIQTGDYIRIKEIVDDEINRLREELYNSFNIGDDTIDKNKIEKIS